MNVRAPHAAQRPNVMDAAAVRSQHRTLILNLIWEEDGLSRADIARRTGLSRSTVSAIVTDLIASKLVSEGRVGTSTGGRRPITLEFQRNVAFIGGIELGATHITAVITNLTGHVTGAAEELCAVRDHPDEALSMARRLIRGLLKDQGLAPTRMVGLGVGVPSPVDPSRPDHILPSVLPKWKDLDVLSYFREAFDCPVLMENDANLGALSEHWWGEGRDGRDLAYLKVATGIGAGFVIGGRLFRGSGGTAGEIGHTAIDPSGPECICGLRGCLVTMVGSEALLRQVSAQLPRYPWSRLAGGAESIDEVVEAALDGDDLAGHVIEASGRTLGIGVANMLNLLNPGRVILGGSLVRAGEILLEPLRQTVESLTLAESVAHADIRESQLDNTSIALGGATLVLEQALARPELMMAALHD